MTDLEHLPPPARRSVRSPSVLRTRLRGGLVAQITWEAPGPILVVQGMRSERTIRALSRAVSSWRTFDRYDRVSLDIRRLRIRSPELAEELADDARRASRVGRRLDFIPPLDERADRSG